MITSTLRGLDLITGSPLIISITTGRIQHHPLFLPEKARSLCDYEPNSYVLPT
jgi:hypothetical protein